jgi:hypothetical protein
MNRNPGEPSEQWFDRAAAEYHAAWDALSTRRRRTSMTGNADADQPAVDEEYDSAMDRLEAADCERGDAAIAVDRERRTSDRTDRMRADLDHRMTDEPSAEPPRRCAASNPWRRAPRVDSSRHRSEPASLPGFLAYSAGSNSRPCQ